MTAKCGNVVPMNFCGYIPILRTPQGFNHGSTHWLSIGDILVVGLVTGWIVLKFELEGVINSLGIIQSIFNVY